MSLMVFVASAATVSCDQTSGARFWLSVSSRVEKPMASAIWACPAVRPIHGASNSPISIETSGSDRYQR